MSCAPDPRSIPSTGDPRPGEASTRFRSALPLALAAAPATADPAADAAAIRQRCRGRTAAFNARAAADLCSRAAPDLRDRIPDPLRGRHETLYGNVAAVLVRSDPRPHCDDPASVRPTWAPATAAGGEPETPARAGIGLFCRQPDSGRFIAFTIQPNGLLQ